MSNDLSSNHNFAFIMTIVAALSQGVGGLVALLGMGDSGASTAHLMSFATGVMLYLSFMDIMVDTVGKIGDLWANTALFGGMSVFVLLQVSLPDVEGTKFAELIGLTPPVDQSAPPTPVMRPSEPAPLGQEPLLLPDAPSARSSTLRASTLRQRPGVGTSASASPDADSQVSPDCRDDSRDRLRPPRGNSIAFSGLIAMVSISLHNIPEGIAVYLTCLKGVKSGLPLAIAMALHNIPEGMAVAGPIYAATKSRRRAVVAATISGMFEVLGCLVVMPFLDAITEFRMEAMLSMVAGIMISLALIELLPVCLEALSPRQMACSCLGGMVFMFVSKSLSTEILSVLE